jgi:hypothetical protein
MLAQGKPAERGPERRIFVARVARRTQRWVRVPQIHPSPVGTHEFAEVIDPLFC